MKRRLKNMLARFCRTSGGRIRCSWNSRFRSGAIFKG